MKEKVKFSGLFKTFSNFSADSLMWHHFLCSSSWGIEVCNLSGRGWQLINAITISFSGIISGSVTNLKNITICLFKDLIHRCKWWNTFLFASLVASLVLVFNVEINYLFFSSLLVENSTRSSLDPNAKFITALKTWQNEFATYMGCWIISWCVSSLKTSSKLSVLQNIWKHLQVSRVSMKFSSLSGLYWVSILVR